MCWYIASETSYTGFNFVLSMDWGSAYIYAKG